MDLTKIFNNNHEWVRGKLAEDPGFFETLAQGQKPEIFYIGCSDSRVPPEVIMGMPPGEMFVHRNIANLVSGQDLSMVAAVEFAVNTLKVAHIVVCGHYACGGVRFAMETDDLGVLNPWLANIRDVCRLHQSELDRFADQDAGYRRLVELNVKEQCVNVLKNPSVQKACVEGRIKIHGWVFDLEKGGLVDLKIDFNEIMDEVKKCYRP